MMKSLKILNKVLTAAPASTLAFCALSLSNVAAQTPVNIDVPKASATSAQCVSDSEDIGIAGWYLDSNGAPGAFLNVNGKITTFALPGNAMPNITRINRKNDLVGWYVDKQGFQHAFLKILNKGITDISPPDAVATYATSIDDADYVSGYYRDSASNVHGFYFDYQQRSYFTIDYPGATLTRVEDASDTGQLIGFYKDANGKSHGFYFAFSGPNGSSSFQTVDYPGATGTELYRIITGSSLGENDTRGYVIGEYALPSGSISGFIKFGPSGRFERLTSTGGYASSRPVSFVGNGNVAIEIPTNPTQKRISAKIPRTGLILGFDQFKVTSAVAVDVSGSITTQIKDANHSGVVVGYYLDNQRNIHAFSFNSQPQ